MALRPMATVGVGHVHAVPGYRLTFIVLGNTPNLATPFPVGGGDLMGSALALAFYREFVFPRIHEVPLPIVDWEASEEQLVAQLGAASDDQAVRFLQQELAAYQGVFYSVGRTEDVDRLRRAGRAVFSAASAPTTYFDTDARSALDAPVALSDDALQRLVGTYVFDEAASNVPAGLEDEPLAWVRVTLEGGTLVACASDGSASFVLPLGEGRFRTTDGIGLDVEFVRGEVARITARPGGDIALVYVPA